MKNMPLLEHLKALKAAIPVPQKEVEVESKLQIFKIIKILAKKESNRDGLFFNESFCFPLLDPPNDPKRQEISALIRGVFEQGGQIIEFHDKMSE
jgi:hypothetical protein